MTFSYESPFGPLLVEGSDRVISRLGFGTAGGPVDAALVERLDAYFAGDPVAFEGLRAAPAAGTEFERRVWQEVASIPYGATATYAEIAARIGRPSACRAVGRANGRNAVALVIPCHRVVGSDGSLTGYAGGLEMKRALLELEARAR